MRNSISYVRQSWLDSIAQKRCHCNHLDRYRMDCDSWLNKWRFHRKHQHMVTHIFYLHTLCSMDIRCSQYIRGGRRVDCQWIQVDMSNWQHRYYLCIDYLVRMDWVGTLRAPQPVWLMRNFRLVKLFLRSKQRNSSSETYVLRVERQRYNSDKRHRWNRVCKRSLANDSQHYTMHFDRTFQDMDQRICFEYTPYPTDNHYSTHILVGSLRTDYHNNRQHIDTSQCHCARDNLCSDHTETEHKDLWVVRVQLEFLEQHNAQMDRQRSLWDIHRSEYDWRHDIQHFGHKHRLHTDSYNVDWCRPNYESIRNSRYTQVDSSVDDQWNPANTCMCNDFHWPSIQRSNHKALQDMDSRILRLSLQVALARL